MNKKSILTNRDLNRATSEFFYCHKDNYTIGNAFQLCENSLCLNDNRLHIEKSRLFTYFKENEEIIDEELSGKNLLLISSGKVGRLPVLHSIQKDKNFSILCLNTPELKWAEPFVDDMIYCNAEENSDKNYEKIMDLINEYSKNKNIKFDGIMTYDDYCVVLFSRIAKEMKLNALDYDVSLKIKNKFQFRKLIKENELFDDVTFILFDQHEINNIINNADYKLETLNLEENRNYIIKDIYGAGKNFVRKFKNFDELRKILNEIKNKDKLKKSKFIVEDYFEGLEIDIDMIVQDYEIKFFSISDNFPSDEENFLEIGGCSPSKFLNYEEQKYIENKTRKMIKVLKINNTCLHFEAKCRPKSMFGSYESDIPFFPIEMNLRLGAAEVFSFNIVSYKYNLFYNSIKMALGKKIEKYVYDNDNQIFCSSINFQAKSSGFVKEISFEKDFFKEKSLVCLVLFCKIGDFINLEENKGNGYLGWMVTKSSISVDESLKKLYNLYEKIVLKIEN